jgi:hypothetical protein
MPVLDVRTWPRGNIPGLSLTDGDVGLLRGVDCDILTQGLIGFDRILIPPRYTFFFGSPTEKNSRLGVLGLEQFHDGWLIEKSSQVHISEDKSVQKRLELVCRLVYDPRGLLGVMTIRSRVAGVLQ